MCLAVLSIANQLASTTERGRQRQRLGLEEGWKRRRDEEDEGWWRYEGNRSERSAYSIWADGQMPKRDQRLCVIDPAPFLPPHHPLSSSSFSAALLAPPSNEDVGSFKIGGTLGVGGPIGAYKAYTRGAYLTPTLRWRRLCPSRCAIARHISPPQPRPRPSPSPSPLPCPLIAREDEQDVWW
ncbi:hypothetical protein CVT26_006515 [Gymnopilus dilepis]|uniref:Uncharacterized protein n=1 Tax=Gymnopilus dilepis TaxID=231916 RepID=A0A409Y3F1_9AGAR|nr:hypothetical protein CVT26_006515 [Gymnopilus dilepis]